jgi:hypothetical protein
MSDVYVLAVIEDVTTGHGESTPYIRLASNDIHEAVVTPAFTSEKAALEYCALRFGSNANGYKPLRLEVIL